MNAERLLQHFECISEAPDAIPRLRRFILDLAVRGKLVEQDPNDESVAELLKRIQKHKVEFAKSGRLERGSAIGALKHDAVPFMLPDGWLWVSFGSIMISRDGERIPVSKEERVDRVKIYDYYGASGVIDKIDGYLFDRPLLLIGEDGANLINRSTPIAFIARGKYWVNNHAHVLDGISEEFLRFIELHINAIDLKSYVTGTAQPKMNQAKMNSIPIALPPLAEQLRIVAKVDELMALCDQLKAAKAEREQSRDRLVAASLHRLNSPADTAETDAPDLPVRQTDAFRDHARFVFNHLPRLSTRPEHIKQLRQTILNLAVRGKLVPQDPNDEPATALLRELREAKDRLQAKENIRSRQPVLRTKLSELGFTIPDSWELPTFDDVFIMVSGVTKGRNLAGRKTIELPYLRVANVQRGYLDLSIMKTISIPEDELPRYALRHGDVLMTEGGDWDKLGRAAIWLDEIAQCIHQNHVFRVRSPLLKKLCPKWVVIYTNSLLGRGYFENAAKQTTNLASINMTQLRGCPLPLPPLAEQHRIVARVDELMALCDQLETQLTATETDNRRLLEVVLHEALNPPLDATT